MKEKKTVFKPHLMTNNMFVIALRSYKYSVFTLSLEL